MHTAPRDKRRALTWVEIDRDLVARLTARSRLTVCAYTRPMRLSSISATLAADAKLRVVGNLPYNISTPILFRLCEFEDRISDMTFMLQKEVVDRMPRRRQRRARDGCR